MSKLRKILFPFSILYDGVTSLRNKLFETGILKSTKFDIPIIVVGNLSVGGTGKTPQIEYLIRLLKEDHNIAVLSRGYKRKTKGFFLADESVTVDQLGDEPFQYYTKFNEVIVAVCEDRVNGINRMKKIQNPPKIILLDDAFQHRKVKSEFNILLTSYNDLYVDDLILPAGNLRESSRGAKRATIAVVTKCPKDLSAVKRQKIKERLKLKEGQYLFFTTINYSNFIKGERGSLSLEELKEYEILLVTGIANPNPLIEFLKSKDLSIKHLKFSDHHDFTQGEIVEIKTQFEKIPIKNKIIITTEKDYVRLKNHLKINFLEIEVAFLEDGEKFDEMIKNYVG